jgi:hypothetical protein
MLRQYSAYPDDEYGRFFRNVCTILEIIRRNALEDCSRLGERRNNSDLTFLQLTLPSLFVCGLRVNGF